MAVADTDGDDSSKQIKISSSGVIEQPLHMTLMEQ